MMAALLYLAVVAAACWLFWRYMEQCFQRAAGSGPQDEVYRLRRGWVERRLGLDRRHPSPPPLWPHKERRRGKDRRRA